MKGQIWSADLTLSAFVFITIAVAFLSAFGYMLISAQDNTELRDMERISLSVSDALIRIPGIPEDWNRSNVQFPGLADRENIINETKLERFSSMDYSTLKVLMGLDKYEFHFRLSDVNGTVYAENGMEPENAIASMPVNRYVLYSGRLARLRFVVWK